MIQKLRAVLLLSGLLTGLIFTTLPALSVNSADTPCGLLATDKGQIKQTVHIEQPSNYTVWLRMYAPNADADSVYVQVDETCMITTDNTRRTDSFTWINYREGDTGKKLTFNLTTGDHTITIAGREAGTGVDKVMVLSNDCEPTDTGDNCLSQTNTVQKTNQTNNVTPGQSAMKRTSHWLVFILAGIAAISAIIYLVWQYSICMKHHGLTGNPLQSSFDSAMVVGGMSSPSAPRLGIVQKLKLFVGHHTLLVVICGSVMLASLTVSIAVAADSKPVFEAESAVLSEGATITTSTLASGGKYIVFNKTNTPTGSTKTQTGSTGSTGQSTGNANSSGGGSSGSSGSTGNPYPSRYSVGAPGVGHYAQSDASLPVPAGYTEYFPSDGTSNAYNLYSCSGTRNIDRAYFHAFLYIGTGCHGTINITNSIIAPPPGSNQRAILVNADNSATLTINITDTTIRPEPVPLGGTNDALTDHVLNDCETCTIHMNRVDVANSGGMCLCGKNTVIEHSWLHDSYIAHLSDPGLAHTGGVFPYGGSGPLEIKYNRLEPGVNAATGAEVTNYWKAITAVLFTQGSGGSMLNNYSVHHNFISLGSFNMGLENGNNLSIHDNVFGPNHFGYVTTCSSGCSVNIGTWTNNVLGTIDGTPTATILPKPF